MRFCVRAVVLVFFSSILSMCVSTEEKRAPVDREKDSQASQKTSDASSDKAKTPVLTDQDFLNILALVTRAKDAGAETYSPGLYTESKNALADALSEREKRPQDAKKLLALAGEKAVAAYNESAKTVYSLFIEPLAATEESLDNMHARSYYPVEYASAIEEGDLAQKLYDSSDISGALTNGKKASEDMASLALHVADGLAWARILLEDVEGGLDTFERTGTYVTETERVDLVVRSYYEGLDALERFDLENAGKSLGHARQLCEGTSIASTTEGENGEQAILPIEKSKEYSIRSIPANRESLWTIAGYDFVYGDPFLWPLIWRINRDTIGNPAFILPGTLIIIPRLSDIR